MACQLGYLKHLLMKCGEMNREKTLLPLVSQAGEVRNELAHYRPVEYSQYERLLKETALIFDAHY